MFGKHDINDQEIWMFAKSDLYIPESFDDLVKHLHIMINFLDLLTGAQSIASQGYRASLNKVKALKMQLIAPDNSSLTKMLWAKIAFFGDGAFQTFVRKLLIVLLDLDQGESTINKA